MKNDLLELALSSKDVLKPFGHTETLLFYACVAPKLEKYLAGREIAAKNWIPKGPMPYLIKRGSRETPLSPQDIAKAVTKEFLETRAREEHLDKARARLSPLQQTVWGYFLPRKLADFFYATNGEKPGRAIDRVFFDLDRGKQMTVAQAQEATRVFVETICDDADFWKTEAGRAVEGKPFVAWTGSSFHVYLFFKKPQPPAVYEKFFQYSKNEPLATRTGKWVAEMRARLKFKIAGGHEKIADAIVVDPSQTPSGKLCRVPLGSLHMKDARTVDGVSLPLDEKMLGEKNLEKTLRAYSPKQLLEELKALAARLPKQFQ